MTADEADALLSALGSRFEIAPGLGDSELDLCERTYALEFPPDLRLLLSRGVPVGDRFPDWRGPREAIEERLRWPEEGILFDVDQGLWPNALGPRPVDPAELRARALSAIRAAPRLVPVYGHRYIPCEPLEAGNPIFSVYQSDVIRYGDDLSSYFQHEFGVGDTRRAGSSLTPRIRFWDDLVDQG